MFGWLRKSKRRRLAAKPFPSDWEDILAFNAKFLESLSEQQQTKIRRSIQVLVAEKNWEGCGGLSVSDEHRVTIAAQIARMTAHFEAEYFDAVLSILIYPTAYMAKSQTQLAGGVIVEGNSGRLGEAWHRGPVILSWNEVFENVRDHYPQRNVVIHEFAHQLDQETGYANGAPALGGAGRYASWAQVLGEEFERLRERIDAGEETLLDDYGATDPVEFFAVVSEAFFEQPDHLLAEHPALYRELSRFYQVDPQRWLPAEPVTSARHRPKGPGR